MLIRVGLGTTIYVATILTAEETHEDDFVDTKGLAEFLGLMAGLLVCLSSTLVGSQIKSRQMGQSTAPATQPEHSTHIYKRASRRADV